MLAGIAALPVVSLPAAAAEPDPIFAAIEAHRKAIQATEAGIAEQQRLIALADEAVGPRSIPVLDMRAQHPARLPPFRGCQLLDRYRDVCPERG